MSKNRRELTMEMLDKAAGGNYVYYPEEHENVLAELRSSKNNRWTLVTPEITLVGHKLERIEDIDKKYQLKPVDLDN